MSEEILKKIKSWKINDGFGDTLDLYKSTYTTSTKSSYFLALNDETKQGKEVDQAWNADNLFSSNLVIDTLSRQFGIECRTEEIRPIVDEANLLLVLYL